MVFGLYRLVLVVVRLGFFERDERTREIFLCKLILGRCREMKYIYISTLEGWKEAKQGIYIELDMREVGWGGWDGWDGSDGCCMKRYEGGSTFI